MSRVVYLTFAAEFNAIHRLWNDNLSTAENLRTFGECANINGHGHLYRIEITVASEATPEKPYVMARGAIARLVEGILAPRLRDGNMNTAFGEVFLSTGEHVSRAIWGLLDPHVNDDVSLVGVKVIETEKNSFVFRRDDWPPGAARPVS